MFNDSRHAGTTPEENLQRIEKNHRRRQRTLYGDFADVVAHEMKEWAIEKVPHTTATGSSLLQA